MFIVSEFVTAVLRIILSSPEHGCQQLLKASTTKILSL